jgi:hypothetical protein
MAKIPKRKGVGQRRRLPRNLAEFDKMPRRSRQAFENVTHAITRMREGASLTTAAAEFGVAPRSVVTLGKSALRKTESGRYVAKPSDKLLRVFGVPVHGGRVDVAVRGSRSATVVSERAIAQRRFVRTGETAQLHTLEGLTLLDASGREVPFLTDLDELERQGDLGMLSYESIYARR